VEFLEFDKYAGHMWLVYFLGLVLIVGNSWWSRTEFKKTRTRVLLRAASRQSLQHDVNGEAA
jgi:hypothetical protein